MAGSDENNPNVIRQSHLQLEGLRVGGGRRIAPIGNNRRALRDINRNIIDVPPPACAVNKKSFLGKDVVACEKNPVVPVHGPVTRKFAAQLAYVRHSTSEFNVLTIKNEGTCPCSNKSMNDLVTLNQTLVANQRRNGLRMWQIHQTIGFQFHHALSNQRLCTQVKSAGLQVLHNQRWVHHHHYWLQTLLVKSKKVIRCLLQDIQRIYNQIALPFE